jgi:hypothetical protein
VWRADANHRVHHLQCQRRLNIDPPCRSHIDPGRVAEF